jgi:hypothetical protein
VAARTGSSSARAPRAEDLAAEVGELLGAGSIASVYRDRVLSQRTRRYELGATGRTAAVEVLHTLLGIELKIGSRRLQCPDLATARYLAVFARLGVVAVAVPYDITQVSRTADELESAWHRTLLLAEHLAAERSERFRSLLKSRLVEAARAAVDDLGAGAQRPAFAPPVRQRKRS